MDSSKCQTPAVSPAEPGISHVWLKSGYQWRMLPSDFPKWRTVYAYFEKWREPAQDGISVLEQALKKSGWRGPMQTGAERIDVLHHRRRAECEKHR